MSSAIKRRNFIINNFTGKLIAVFSNVENLIDTLNDFVFVHNNEVEKRLKLQDRLTSELKNIYKKYSNEPLINPYIQFDDLELDIVDNMIVDNNLKEISVDYATILCNRKPFDKGELTQFHLINRVNSVNPVCIPNYDYLIINKSDTPLLDLIHKTFIGNEMELERLKGMCKIYFDRDLSVVFSLNRNNNDFNQTVYNSLYYIKFDDSLLA